MNHTPIRQRLISIRSVKPERRVIVSLLLVLLVGCNGKGGPTDPGGLPTSPPQRTPTPAAPTVNVAGDWSGVYDVTFDSTDCGTHVAASARLAQEGSQVTGTLSGGCVAGGTVLLTLGGAQLTGTVTIVQEGRTFIGRTNGTASALELQLFIGDLSGGNGSFIPGGHLDLHR